MSVRMRPSTLSTRDKFSKLYPQDRTVLQAIIADMRTNGYDPTKPIYAVRDPKTKDVVVLDGHTKLTAAVKAKIKEVPVEILNRFAGPEDVEAERFAHLQQLNRRNLTTEQLHDAMNALAKLGTPVKEIAQASGRSVPQVNKVTQATRRQVKADKAETIDTAVANGASTREAARAAGVSHVTVQKVVRNARNEQKLPLGQPVPPEAQRKPTVNEIKAQARKLGELLQDRGRAETKGTDQMRYEVTVGPYLADALAIVAQAAGITPQALCRSLFGSQHITDRDRELIPQTMVIRI